MSLAVGVLCGGNVALATDSVHIAFEATGPVVTTNFVKHVRVGNRAAAILGVATWENHRVLDWVHYGLANAKTFEDILVGILRAGEASMVDAFLAWSKQTSHASPPEEFLTILIVEASSARTSRAMQARAVVVDNELTLQGDPTFSADSTPVVIATGVVDRQLLAHTYDGQVLQHALHLTGRANPVPGVAPLPHGLTSQECRDVAQGLVEAAIGREGGLPRPAWMPADFPLIAGPVHSLALP